MLELPIRWPRNVVGPEMFPNLESGFLVKPFPIVVQGYTEGFRVRSRSEQFSEMSYRARQWSFKNKVIGKAFNFMS